MRKNFSHFALQTPGVFEFRIALIEPALVVSALFFWIAALPFVAVSLRCVRIWDALIAWQAASSNRSNPLILRDRPAESSPTATASTRTAQS
jgi:hypothetical protein